jgi:preprotein translocase subunit SecD
MSTILDLIVVFLFTHPIVSTLSRNASFGSARFSGLGSVRAGGIATSDNEAIEPRRGPRRTRRAPAEPSSDVAVLDEEDDLTETAVPGADGEASTDDVDEPESPAEPRRRTTPQAGTAAERAAARRARLRDQGGSGEEKR